jgi:tRNA-dihydrouridine synthase C
LEVALLKKRAEKHFFKISIKNWTKWEFKLPSYPLFQNDRPGVILAPMEGVTDAPMRALLTEQGSFLFCVSEFLRVTDQVPPTSVFYRHIPELKQQSLTPSGTPVLVQLLGGNAQKLAESAIRAVSLGAKGIDLNFGCPAPTVNRHDGGATLLKYPKRLFEIVSTVRGAVPLEIPVSAKVRLGWSEPDDIFENVEAVAKGGASWVTIHARTRMQGYAKPVFWDHIRRVRELRFLPVVANGDIWNFQDFLKCYELTGCEHFMVGRGAVGNPLLATSIDSFFQKKAPSSQFANAPDSPGDWRPFVERFVTLSQTHTDKPEYIVRRIKQWVKLASIERPLPWFEELKRTQTLDECLKTFAV